MTNTWRCSNGPASTRPASAGYGPPPASRPFAAPHRLSRRSRKPDILPPASQQRPHTVWNCSGDVASSLRSESKRPSPAACSWTCSGLRALASCGASHEDDKPLIEYVVDRTATYVLRLQPELLRSGRFTLAERTIAALRTFPVTGLTSRAVQSGFGAARDSGNRSHEGIDIFAPRGTAVVAVTDGVARSDTNGLGGNVVWLRDGLIGGTRYYYAHLDRWAIEGTTRVREGDVLGYVGNTGNARTTSSHLHFGVYDDGALAPAPFLQPDESVARLTVEPALLGTLVRTRSGRTPLRAGPSPAAPQRVLLEPETIGQRLGIAGGWYRMLLPDGAVGYVADNAVVSAGVPLRRQRATRPLGLREKPQPTAPLMTTLAPGAEVEVLGRFQQFDFIRAAQGVAGWTDASPQR